MRISTAIRLGRVSNLPTVWSNVLAGIVLAGAAAAVADWIALLLSFSLFYTGGMYLNDYYDREYDAAAKPDRPIPLGEAPAATVFYAGTAMLTAAVMAVCWVSLRHGTLGSGLAAAGALALTIVAYDRNHKANPFGPLLMALCRVLIYVGCAAALIGIPAPATLGACVVLLGYLVALTYVAKRGADDRTVALLIAGISLLDSAFIAAAGQGGLAVLAAVGFPSTLVLQRWVRGT